MAILAVERSASIEISGLEALAHAGSAPLLFRLGVEPVILGCVTPATGPWIRVDSLKVARRHLTIQWRAGRCTVAGVSGFVWNERLVERAELNNGDRIRVGPAELRWYESVERIPAPACPSCARPSPEICPACVHCGFDIAGQALAAEHARVLERAHAQQQAPHVPPPPYPKPSGERVQEIVERINGLPPKRTPS